jgi:hypothetical protein
MFAAPPSKADLAKMKHLGLTPEDYAGDDVEVWPENQRAYFLFAQVQTQWRVGAMGPTGLDYNTLFRKMDRMRLEPDEYDELEADIRTMEFAALDAMSTKD